MKISLCETFFYLFTCQIQNLNNRMTLSIVTFAGFWKCMEVSLPREIEWLCMSNMCGLNVKYVHSDCCVGLRDRQTSFLSLLLMDHIPDLFSSNLYTLYIFVFYFAVINIFFCPKPFFSPVIRDDDNSLHKHSYNHDCNPFKCWHFVWTFNKLYFRIYFVAWSHPSYHVMEWPIMDRAYCYIQGWKVE